MMPQMWRLLLQTDVERRTSPAEVLFWVGLLVGVSLFGGILIVILRRRLMHRDDKPEDSGGFLNELRRLRNAGEISLEQYEASRDALLGRGPARARTVLKGEIHEDGTILARPGFDLTGTPLPPPSRPAGGDGETGPKSPG